MRSMLIGPSLLAVGLLVACGDARKDATSSAGADDAQPAPGQSPTSPSAGPQPTSHSDPGSEPDPASPSGFVPAVAGRWEPLPLAGQILGYEHVATTWVAGKLFTFGGSKMDVVPMVTTNACSVYAPATSSWSECASEGRPSARYDAAVLAVGSKVLVVGGYEVRASDGPYGHGLRDGAVYDAQSGKWSALPEAPLYVSQGTTSSEFALGGKAYFWDRYQSTFSPQLVSYDAGAWQTLAAPGVLVQERNALAVPYKEQGIIVYGGTSIPAKNVFGAYYDIASNQWSAIPAPSGYDPSSQLFFTSIGFTAGDAFYFFAVMTGGSKRAFRYDIAGGAWTTIAVDASAPTVFQEPRSAQVNQAGKAVLDTPLFDLLVFDPTNGVWSPGGPTTNEIFRALPPRRIGPGHAFELFLDLEHGLMARGDSWLYRYTGDLSVVGASDL